MLKEGQVLWLKFRFNNRPGDISTTVHPYVVVNIDLELSSVELIQCDSIKGKLHKAYMKQNMFIDATNETVFNEHGFAQLDNCFMVEYNEVFLETFRRTEDTMTPDAFKELKRKYQEYQMLNQVYENNIVFLSTKELEKIN